MSDMDAMSMPGGWTMSMVWMGTSGQTWLAAGAAFLGMWSVMTIAMMVPSLGPVIWRYIESARGGEAFGGVRCGAVAGPASLGPRVSRGRLAPVIAIGYFSVWGALGVAVFWMGAALAALATREPDIARAVPIGAGVVVLAAGALQFTSWKTHHLALCREWPCSRVVRCPRRTLSSSELWPDEETGGRESTTPENAVAAFKSGLRLGFHCNLSSAGFTAILLVVGVMDLRTMAAVTAAITTERLASDGQRVARAIGAAVLVAGTALIISAA